MPDIKLGQAPDKLIASSGSPARANEVLDTMSSTKKRWNTKNLGLRLSADFAAAGSAAGLVAPIIMIIDKYVAQWTDQSLLAHNRELDISILTRSFCRGIMQNASGQNTLGASLKESLKTLITKPHHICFSKPVALIWMLYGGTFLTANTLDTATSTIQNKPSALVTAGTLKSVTV